MLIRHPGLSADRQWIIILKTLELVTLSFSQFHAQRNLLLTNAYVSLQQQQQQQILLKWDKYMPNYINKSYRDNSGSGHFRF